MTWEDVQDILLNGKARRKKKKEKQGIDQEVGMITFMLKKFFNPFMGVNMYVSMLIN